MAVVFLAAVAVTACCAAVIPLFATSAADDALIRIPKGATTQSVTDSVRKYLGDGFADRFNRAARGAGVDFGTRHGAWLIESGMSPAKALRRLAKGAQQPVKLTYNNVRTLPLLADRIAARLDFAPDSLTDALTPEILEAHGLAPDQAIALFIDDTFEFYWSASPKTVVDKIGANYDRVWNDERRAKAEALGLTPAQVMTVCSIIDEETNAASEKGTVGRLYLNRLEKGMPLQADPTVKFAVGDFTIKRITGQHLKVDSPYNTYMHRGLPPGPIRTTSVATIDALLNSKPHNYIYMCAKEDFSGTHNFASDFATHQANARRYQQALDALGIK